MIAPLIKWDHSQDWLVVRYGEKSKDIIFERKITVSLSNEECSYMKGHIIDGK